MITILKFSASWCKPCQAFIPTFKQVREHFEGKDVDFKEIDIEHNTIITNKYKIKSVPTILILKDEEEIKRLVGTTTKSELIEEINNLL